jgi:hypothetical protein
MGSPKFSLKPLLGQYRFDVSQPVYVRELPGRRGYTFTQ